MNIVLKKPAGEPAYDASLAAGNWQTWRASAGATGPLHSDRLLYRVDFGVDTSDNWRHDPWTKWNVTPSLAWQIGARDQFEARYAFNRNDVSGDGGIPLVNGADGPFIPDVPRDRRYNTPQDFGLSVDQNLRTRYAHLFAGG